LKANILLIVIFIIPLLLFSQFLEEGFESGDLSSYDWELSGSAYWFVTGSFPFSGDYCARGGTVNHNQSTTIEITLDFPNSGILSFAWKVSSELNYDFLRFYLDDEQMAQISGTVAWTQVAYELSAGIHNLRWSYVKDYSVSSGNDTGWIDDVNFFILEPSYDYDLEIVNLVGPEYLTGGSEYNYEVTVRNNGSYNFTGYSVSLVNGEGMEYDSETIYWMLPPGEERIVELTIDLEEACPDTVKALYGYGCLVNDENPENDYSGKLDIHQAGADYHFAHIGGAETYTNLIPVNFLRKASIYQTIYFADELQQTGAIRSIDLFNDFANPVFVTNLRIWIGETECSTLHDGWIGADSLQLVFDNEYEFSAGSNLINIALENLFEYNGGNLVMMIEKAYEDELNSWQSNFRYSEIMGEEAGRTRFNYSDLGNFDPTNLQSGILCDWVANTVFTISPVPYGHLAGIIYNEMQLPLSGAQISISDYNWTGESDSLGCFLIERIDIGTYTMVVEMEGYEIYEAEIEIISGELTEVEVIMQEASGIINEEIVCHRAAIGKIYPNPFYPGKNRSNLKIDLELNTADLPAKLGIYDIKGRKIAERVISKAGSVSWDALSGSSASGIYLFKLTTANGQSDSSRLLLVK
jgi:hypothetical protein